MGGDARGELLDDVYGAVLAASATDGDRQVAAIGRLVLGYARLDEGSHIVDEARNPGLRLEEVNHGLVATGQRAQRRLPVGIGQGARVEHEIRITRDAVLEPEGLEQQ